MSPTSPSSASAVLGKVGRFMDRLEAVLLVPRGHGSLLRPRFPRVLGGVCSGIAAYYGWDISVLRALVVVLTVASSGLLVAGYALGWVLIPEGTYALPPKTAAR